MKLPTILNISAVAPYVAHVHVPTTPPGRTTRASSAAACSCRGANMWPKVDSTRSNEASSNGSDSASAWTHSTSTPAAAARARAASNSSGVRSEPVTLAPRWAAGMATVPPLPVPTSSTSMPGSMPTRSSSTGPTAAMVSETVSQSPPAHVVRARCLNSVTGVGHGDLLNDRLALPEGEPRRKSMHPPGMPIGRGLPRCDSCLCNHFRGKEPT